MDPYSAYYRVSRFKPYAKSPLPFLFSPRPTFRPLPKIPTVLPIRETPVASEEIPLTSLREIHTQTSRRRQSAENWEKSVDVRPVSAHLTSRPPVHL